MKSSNFRFALFSDFNVENFARVLNSDSAEPALLAVSAPFGSLVRSLLSGLSDGNAEPDYGVAWSRPEAAVPSFGKILRHEAVSLESLLSEVDSYCDLLGTASKRMKGLAVVNWTLPPWDRGLGARDAELAGGHRFTLREMNRRLQERVRGQTGMYFLDADSWLAACGPKAYSSQLWYLSKTPFSIELFRHAAAEVKALLRASLGAARKLVLLDLDDTLWGGIVGDAGRENLVLGGHDAIGEAFVDFQRGLMALKNRGILLGIVSKNTESIALDAIDNHPEMILRRKDFVGWRINWKDKAANIAELVAELNLGLQSVVFLDDNHLERERVREALPEVLVPEWPKDKMLYSETLAALRCFDTLGLSTEDTKRTEEYLNNKRREDLRKEVSSVDDWLKSIELKVRVEALAKDNFSRALQLLNKTNQMNLSTRRLSERELSDWAENSENSFFVFRVADKFDDSGLTGIASVKFEGETARVVDFLLSCRVMGRKVEQAMLHVLATAAAARGAKTLEATFLPTAKNQPCLEFLRSSGLTEASPASVFCWSLLSPFPLPECLSLEREAAS